MRVALINLTSGGMSGGYYKYLRALLPLLRRDPRVSRLDVFMPLGLERPDESPVHWWKAATGLEGQNTLRQQLADVQSDVVFFPTARRVDCGGLPTVVMVRNMEPLAAPCRGNTWREALRNLARAQAARSACQRASRVIAVSTYVKHFLVRSWGIPPDRVRVVYHGIDGDGGPTHLPPTGLTGVNRFVLTAGSIRPARGLEDLITAAPHLLRSDPALRIAIAGQADASGSAYERKLRRLAHGLRVSPSIVWLGQLTTAELTWAYRRCAAFVVTSRVEACPNVALEAMRFGARIVSTTQDPMPEFFEDIATYYSPGNAGELSQRLSATLAAASEGSTRAETGRARASAFTWQRTADQTIEELERAVHQRHSGSAPLSAWKAR